jgi:hypothetical protein
VGAVSALFLGGLNPMVSSGANGMAVTAPTTPPGEEPVTVEGRLHHWDEKPHRNLLKAMKVFDENRSMAPHADIRFRVPLAEFAAKWRLNITHTSNTHPNKARFRICLPN